MPAIDMDTIKPVGEFGSKAWGEACAQSAITMLQSVELPSNINWAFTEDYTHPPERLLNNGRSKSGYHIIVKNGKVRAGDGITEESLTIPGFHVQLPWAYICNQSGMLYGRDGQKQRSSDEQVLMADIIAYIGNDNPFNFPINGKGKPSGMLDPVGAWPTEVGLAFSEGGEEGNGLHNIAATLQMDSPEFEGMPVTKMRVPIFNKMTDVQKQNYLSICGLKK